VPDCLAFEFLNIQGFAFFQAIVVDEYLSDSASLGKEIIVITVQVTNRGFYKLWV
jgi:hypothetical protein